MQDFRTLRAWQQAHALALDVLRDTVQWFPADLAASTRHAALLLPSTLARGCTSAALTLPGAVRLTRGHLNDLAAHLLLARDLDALLASDYAAFDIRIARLRYSLDTLERSVRRRPEALVLN